MDIMVDFVIIVLMNPVFSTLCRGSSGKPVWFAATRAGLGDSSARLTFHLRSEHNGNNLERFAQARCALLNLGTSVFEQPPPSVISTIAAT